MSKPIPAIPKCSQCGADMIPYSSPYTLAEKWECPNHEKLKDDFTRLEESGVDWMGQAIQFAKDMEYYRGLLDQCAKHLGPGVFISDDGSIQDTPIRAKIPEMVASLSLLAEGPAKPEQDQSKRSPG